MKDGSLARTSIQRIPSFDEIRSSYGTAKNEALPLRFKRAELTPSARHLVKEVRKIVSENHILASEKELSLLLSEVEEVEGEELSQNERVQALAVLQDTFQDFEILTPLIEQTEVNDIIVRSFDDISIQCGRKNIQSDLGFSDAASYKSFVERLLKRTGKACTTATPVVDAALTPEIRLCVTHESFSPEGSGPMLTLRVSRHRDISLGGLNNLELAPRHLLDYLTFVLRDGHATILVSGEVGVGKTTLVRALAAEIPETEALLIIEDTHEIVVRRNFVRTLLTREANSEGAGRISPAQAIRAGLRMAMNRIILGEMRDPEAAEAFIDVCASGHCGLSTIHAKSARDGLARLELFLLRAQGDVGVSTVRREIANAVNVVVHIGQDRSAGKRRILEVSEVNGCADGTIQISPIFHFSESAPREGAKEGPVKARWARSLGISQYASEPAGELALAPPGTTFSLEEIDQSGLLTQERSKLFSSNRGVHAY